MKSALFSLVLVLIVGTVLGVGVIRITHPPDAPLDTLRLRRLELVGPDGTPQIILAPTEEGGWIMIRGPEDNSPMVTLTANSECARVVVASKIEMNELRAAQPVR